MTYTMTMVTAEDERPFLALVDLDGERWNGWQLPLFPMSSVLAIRDMLDEERACDPDGPRITVEGDTVTLHARTDGADGMDGLAVVYSPRTVGGELYWPVGEADWTWCLAQYACAECGDEIAYHEIGEDETRPGIDPVPVVTCKSCATAATACKSCTDTETEGN